MPDIANDLYTLAMSAEAQPLMDAVTKHIADNVEPITEEFQALEKEKTDRWSWHPRQLELLDGAKQKAKDSGLWNFFLPDSDIGDGLTNLDYAYIASELGKYPLASETLNCSAPDTGNMEVLERVGTPEQKEQWLKPLLNGDIRSAYAMTEPNLPSSDAKNISTSAVLDGDDWVINGQKIWTSGAQHSDFGILITRTDPEVPKHRGLTMFFLDMKSAGIDIRPIKQANGDSGFNEVYFDNVRIPDAQRLGNVGQGWQVALTTLMNERASIGGGGGGVNFDSVFELAQSVDFGERPAIEDPSVRRKLADWYVQEAGLKFTGYRSMTALSKGEIPGPENSIGKLVGAPKQQDMASFALDLLEQAGVIWDEKLSERAGLFQATYMASPGLRIAGGTDEIMANIIAERVLGMPQDIRVDKGIPFSEVPTASS